MKPATAPRPSALDERLLRIDPRAGRFSHGRVRDLASLLRRGDLLVVNDAATLPASIQGLRADGSAAELRLLEAPVDGRARAVLFGPGDWHTPTEHRPAPSPAKPGERLRFSGALGAEVLAIDARHPRLLEVRFSPAGDPLWPALYAAARPIQYSYLAGPLELWSPQNVYAGRPWAVEMPSAGRPLRWELLLALRARGVEWARLTHAAGISSTGDAALDAALPLRERYEIPAETVSAIDATRQRGGRIIAVGTSVVRALESAALGKPMTAGPGETELIIGPGFVPRVAQGLLTGMHEPTASHFALLQAFAPGELIRTAYANADELGYLGHEFGDSSLILSD